MKQGTPGARWPCNADMMLAVMSSWAANRVLGEGAETRTRAKKGTTELLHVLVLPALVAEL